MKIILRNFGFFESLPEGMAKDAIKGFVRPFSDAEREKIVNYLESGKLLMMIAGVARDRLSDSLPIIGTQHVLTDGRWAWTEDVIFYVKNYGVVPPPAFEENMKKNGWVVDSVPNMAELVIET